MAVTLLVIVMLASGVQQDSSGTIRGQVVDLETGLPLPRAMVTLHLMASNETLGELADADGRFQFRHVPAGAFDLSAVAGQSVATHVRGWYAGRGPGRPTLKPGEILDGVVISLRRGLAISGRVLNEAGEPLARVPIRVREMGTGAQHFSGFGRTSDDRGAYRVFGLEPGRYVVCAEMRESGQITASEPRAERYATTCHPSAGNEATAVAVHLRAEDKDGVDIRMRRTKTYSVSGIVLDSQGRPLESGMVSLGVYTTTSSSGSPIPLRPGGAFAVHGVPPGQYSVSAEIGGPDRPDAPRDLERGAVAIEIFDTDVKGVVITTRKGATIAGRVIFENATPPPDWRSGAPFSIRPAWTPPLRRQGVYVRRSGGISDDLTFELEDVFGPVRLTAMNPPRGWMIASVRYRGRDISETPTEFPPGRHEVEVILTDRGARVSGIVTDDRGHPAVGARVVLFPADPADREEGAAYDTTVRTNREGRFGFAPRRPGDYLIVAIPGAGEPYGDYTLALFARLATVAERLTLLDADRRHVDLRLTVVPEERRMP